MRAGACAPSLSPWRDVVAPHPEVASGGYAQAEFAADLGHVHAGGGGPAYADAQAFFARTHLTDGLRRLLLTAARRVSGGGGEPVVQLRTGFGGGKTHALLALYHLFGGGAAGADGPEGADARRLLEADGIAPLPRVRVAVLAGTELSPARPWPSRALGGQSVRTLWGELAAQLGGRQGYAAVRDEDEQAVPPGAGTLARLLDAHGPCAVLLDELVPFLRPLYARSGLAAGGFDAQLTFIHNLTEAAKRSRAGMVVCTLPVSDAEIGGEGGRAAAERLAATFGRLEAVWRPAAAAEGAEVVRRRLFETVRDEGAREATCRAFAGMYAQAPGDFPGECRAPDYLDRLRAAYPLHPELFDLLEPAWASLEGFQGTRGVLRLMAAAVHALWRRRDEGALILPGSVPLDAPPVRDPLTRCLDPAWGAVVDADVDGARSGPAAIERENPRFARGQVARRLARSIFLGSAPPGRRQAGGVERARLRLGAWMPEDSDALFGDALRILEQRLTHLHAEGGRLWLEARPNLLGEAAQRAAAVSEARAAEEAHRRLRAAGRRADTGVVGAVHFPGDGARVPDDPVARLAVLPLSHGHRAGGPSPAVELAARLLEERTRHPNMLVFLAADAGEAAGVCDAARQRLGWAALAEEAARGVVQLDAYRRGQLERGLARADETLRLRLGAAYQWLLVPVREAGGPLRWDALRVPGEGDPAERAVRRLGEEGIVHARWSPAELRLALDRWLWREAPHAEVRRVWEALTAYLYLPRLAREDVLLDAVARGAEEGEAFAYADGVTPAGRYLGLRRGAPGTAARGEGLIVRPEAAQGAGGDGEQGAVRAEAGAVPSGGGSGLRAPAGAGAVRGPRRFRGSVALDPARSAQDAARVAEEIVRHLAAISGSEVAVTLLIDARVPAGLPAAVCRVLRENAAALKFRVAEFEGGD